MSGDLWPMGHTPGYWRMAHPCACPCHRPPAPKSLEIVGPITPQPSIFPSHSATSPGAG